MTLSEFKVIFYWEYAHRLLARFVGLFTLIPLVIFSFKYSKTKYYSNKYYFIFLLICLQGLVGWYMVSSGLINNNDVSHFRLSLHLFLALSILSLIFWYIMELYQVQKFQKKISSFLLLIILKLIVIQIIIGAFLSGLDGGLIYNTWPGMNGNFFPDDINLKDTLNFQIFNDVSIIQFLHRFNAYFLLFFVIILNYYFFKKSNEIKFIILFDIAILIQIILGVITLVSGVEIKYASLHQLGSIFVLSSYLLLFYKNSS
jgi:cytochrome c oxidase assembly protein subunit 15